jgi:hypothetical protein
LYDDLQPFIQEQVVYWLSRESALLLELLFFFRITVTNIPLTESDFPSCVLYTKECKTPTIAIDQDERQLQDIYDYIVRFEDDIIAINDWLVENCGTTNPDFLVNLAGSLLGYICVAVAIVWRLKDAFQCSTWLPLYYYTVYNALCYNGVNGVWDIAATQFLTCFMTCVILTCRCVFFDLKIEGEELKEKIERIVAEGDEEGHIGTAVDNDKDETKEKMEKAVTEVDGVVQFDDVSAEQAKVEEKDKKELEMNEKAMPGELDEVFPNDERVVQVRDQEEKDDYNKQEVKNDTPVAEGNEKYIPQLDSNT